MGGIESLFAFQLRVVYDPAETAPVLTRLEGEGNPPPVLTTIIVAGGIGIHTAVTGHILIKLEGVQKIEIAQVQGSSQYGRLNLLTLAGALPHKKGG